MRLLNGTLGVAVVFAGILAQGCAEKPGQKKDDSEAEKSSKSGKPDKANKAEGKKAAKGS